MKSLSNSLTLDQLMTMLVKQVQASFPDGDSFELNDYRYSADIALKRLEYCFSAINDKYFFNGKKVIFDHLHGDQYAAWLYFISNQLYLDNAPVAWSKKIFLLNKLLHGCDIFYEIELPNIFRLVHPVGTVLGRGTYQDYFMVFQRCGIGSNHDVYPQLGSHLTMRPGSSILGDCSIGDNVTIAAESYVLDRSIDPNTVYFGSPRNYWCRDKSLTEKTWRIQSFKI